MWDLEYDGFLLKVTGFTDVPAARLPPTIPTFFSTAGPENIILPRSALMSSMRASGLALDIFRGDVRGVKCGRHKAITYPIQHVRGFKATMPRPIHIASSTPVSQAAQTFPPSA